MALNGHEWLQHHGTIAKDLHNLHNGFLFGKR